ncbi:uncharacterized protein LOC121859050 [Homarus americanus]|uniref:uncharacterized protein LOC121859050 n=1 Tax=Homarus americanus TaxID=6706 RepID=UPI001C46D24F|nr:uncharacterized protein LOC121859050 [Homarus americanus]
MNITTTTTTSTTTMATNTTFAPNTTTTNLSSMITENRISSPQEETRYNTLKIEIRPLDPFEHWSEGGDVEDWEVVGYSIVIPAICGIGIIANALSLVVLLKGADRLKESLYIYLKAVLSAADLVTVVLILLSGLARGVWSSSFAWKCFDAFVHLPVVSIATLVAVTVERVAIIRTPFLSRTLCTASVAHKTCLLVLLGSVVFNVPYCFTFTVAPGHLAYSDFASSRYYTVHNWVRLVVLGLVPAVTLLLGNLLLLHALWCPRRDSLPPRPLVSCTHLPLQDQRRLSWVLVGMICSFLVGEFPTHVASRASATSLLFPGQPQYLYTQGFRSELQIGSSTQVSGGAVTLSGVGFRCSGPERQQDSDENQEDPSGQPPSGEIELQAEIFITFTLTESSLFTHRIFTLLKVIFTLLTGSSLLPQDLHFN